MKSSIAPSRSGIPGGSNSTSIVLSIRRSRQVRFEKDPPPRPSGPSGVLSWILPAPPPPSREYPNSSLRATSVASSILAVAESTCTRSEEHTSELQSLMRISYAVFCLQKKIITQNQQPQQT